MRFGSILLGIFLMSAIVGALLGQFVGIGVVLVFMVLPQFLLLIFRLIFMPRDGFSTDSNILRVNLCSLLFGFLAFVTMVSIQGLGVGTRMGLITVIVAGFVWAGVVILRISYAGQFSQVRL